MTHRLCARYIARSLALALASVAAAFAIPATATATATAADMSSQTVAILGTGRVGGALGPQFAKLGATVIYGSREPGRTEVQELIARTGPKASAASPADAVAKAGIVVLAIPWSATEQLVRSLPLAGKLVIDPTNAMRVGAGGLMEMAVSTSGGELVQSWAPGARVVKAFNALSYTVMADPASAGGPVTVPIAGDDAAARKQVADYVRGIGLEAYDAGPMRLARSLEAMVILYMVPWMTGRRDAMFEYYLRPTPPPKETREVRPAG